MPGDDAYDPTVHLSHEDIAVRLKPTNMHCAVYHCIVILIEAVSLSMVVFNSRNHYKNQFFAIMSNKVTLKLKNLAKVEIKKFM